MFFSKVVFNNVSSAVDTTFSEETPTAPTPGLLRSNILFVEDLFFQAQSHNEGSDELIRHSRLVSECSQTHYMSSPFVAHMTFNQWYHKSASNLFLKKRNS